MTNPLDEHMRAIDQTIYYLYATRFLSIEYSVESDELNASDASFGDNTETRHSHQGYIMARTEARWYGKPPSRIPYRHPQQRQSFKESTKSRKKRKPWKATPRAGSTPLHQGTGLTPLHQGQQTNRHEFTASKYSEHVAPSSVSQGVLQAETPSHGGDASG